MILIAGGDGKGQDFSPLAAPVSAHVRTVILIGRDAPAIRQALAQSAVTIKDCTSLFEAVMHAASIANQGDTVLLSPACASFDMFANYAERAKVFIDGVREIGLSQGEVMA